MAPENNFQTLVKLHETKLGFRIKVEETICLHHYRKPLEAPVAAERWEHEGGETTASWESNDIHGAYCVPVLSSKKST